MLDSENVLPIDVNDCNTFCNECAKRDALYANLRSKSDDEKEKWDTQIKEMASKLAQLQINYTNLHSECVQKDALHASLRSEYYVEKETLNIQIKEMTSKMAQLQKNFTKMRKKAYYLSTTKSKLLQTIKDIKQQNLINSELQNLLEVCMNSNCNSTSYIELDAYRFPESMT